MRSGTTALSEKQGINFKRQVRLADKVKPLDTTNWAAIRDRFKRKEEH